MSDQENFNLDEVISGDRKIEYVDKLELLREKVNSKGVLSSRSNKKELIEIVENLIDLMPVELRTARWLVREQDTYLNKAREEANEILSIAKLESDRLIADSYVLQEAVNEANALIALTSNLSFGIAPVLITNKSFSLANCTRASLCSSVTFPPVGLLGKL